MKSETKQIKLFEIVLTVVLITFISSVLFPYGIRLYEGAQREGFNATSVSFSLAVQSIHNKWLLNKSATVLLTMADGENLEILVNKQGWPLAVLKNINEAMKLNVNVSCVDLWKNLLSNPPTLALEMSRSSQYWLKEESAQCLFISTELKEKNTIVYDSNTGQVLLK